MMHDTEKRTKPWMWLMLTIIPFMLYWLSIGPFFHWEQSAHTQKQFLARKTMERRVYAPVIWLEQIDRTHTVFFLDYLNIQPWVNARFNYTKLPAE